MAVESKRGCGYRKVGGLYMVGDKLTKPCGLFPLELHVCPVCSQGVKQTRSWAWVVPGKLFADQTCRFVATGDCVACAGVAVLTSQERAGLLWVGGSFYPTPADFTKEAAFMGVSRRVSAVPKGFKLGETWVLIAHPAGAEREPRTEEEREELARLNEGLAADGVLQKTTLARKAVIAMFCPQRLEKIVTASQAADAAAMLELEQKGITPVVVPDDDADHKGRVRADAKNGAGDSGELFDEDADEDTGRRRGLFDWSSQPGVS